MSDSSAPLNDTRKVFMQKGTCSRTFCYLLDREFGRIREKEERAADPLAGGILLRGHQCGMLWGSAIAAGAESLRRYEDRGRATAAAITATGRIMDSYAARAGSVNCRDVTQCDFTRTYELMKFMLKFMLNIDRSCFTLAEQWAPEAIRSARDGISCPNAYSQPPVSCASVLAGKMGAGDEEAATVAGLAGGMGLSGNACGALGAAIWLKALAWCRENPGKSGPGYKNPAAERILKAFKDETGSEMLCRTITGRRFTTIDEHTEFIKNGGCGRLIDLLARS